MSKIVVSNTGNRKLHSRRNCPQIKSAKESTCGTVTLREATAQEEEIRDECRMCHVEIVDCEFCGESFNIQGLNSHKRFCDENPDRVGSKVPVLND